MKKIVALVLLVALAGGGYYWYSRPAADSEKVTDLFETKVERGSIKLSVNSTGRVVSKQDVEIKCKASGQVVTLPFDISDAVRKDELMVELDPKDEERQVKQATVSLLSSKSRLAQAQQTLRNAEESLKTDRARAKNALEAARAKAVDSQSKAGRLKQLLDNRRVSQEEYETAQTAAVQANTELRGAEIKLDELKVQEDALQLKREDVTMADIQVQTDEISLDLANQRLRDTKVYAPMDGVISDRTVQIGQIISSPISNVSGGTALMMLSDLSQMFVLAAVDESDIGKIQANQPVNITVDAYPGTLFAGKVVRIATQGKIDSNVVSFEVKVEVDSKDRNLLKPEMTANVEIIAAQKDNALIVPVGALTRKKDQRYALVPGGTPEAPREVPVEVGIDSGVQAEILSGLQEGDTVLVNENLLDSRWSEGGGGAGRPGAQNTARAAAQRTQMMMRMGGGAPRGGGGRR